MMSKNPMGVFSVSMLNETIRSLLVNDPRLREVWVRGEISNLKKHSSGHYYFTLKGPKEPDKLCQLQADEPYPEVRS